MEETSGEWTERSRRERRRIRRDPCRRWGDSGGPSGVDSQLIVYVYRPNLNFYLLFYVIVKGFLLGAVTGLLVRIQGEGGSGGDGINVVQVEGLKGWVGVCPLHHLHDRPRTIANTPVLLGETEWSLTSCTETDLSQMG